MTTHRHTPAECKERRTDTTVDWETLYEEIGERVFRMLHRMVRDAELAHDLTHDAFLRMHRARRQFSHSGPLHAWAFRIAANVGRDALRRRDTRRKYVDESPARGRAAHAPSRRDLERLALAQALRDLSATQRTVLLLHDVDGYTHCEIAEMLSIAEGTSKARLSRARSAMRSSLSERRPPAGPIEIAQPAEMRATQDKGRKS